MRLATFNVENLFQRAEIMNLKGSWDAGRQVLDDFNRLNCLIQLDNYSAANKSEMLKIMGRNKGLLTTGESKYMRLQEIRGKLVKRPKNAAPIIVASGRPAWVGWFELKMGAVKETATENTARVMRELQADVLCVVEAEDRIALKKFNDQIVPKVGTQPFAHVMLIDGNDDRGIDVGILARDGYSIERMVSHVDDRDAQGAIFSRDCAEYLITNPAGEKVLLLVNHFKSKGYGSQADSDAKRKRQAERVREIYEKRLQEGFKYIAIAGDFNDTPDSPPLAGLLHNGLSDVTEHPKFKGDGRPGTYGNGAKSGKIDYILMSPELKERVQSAGVERRGVWGGKNGDLFPHFPEIKKETDAASDHAALWVEWNV